MRAASVLLTSLVLLSNITACRTTPEHIDADGAPGGKGDDATSTPGLRQWMLIGNALTPGHDVIDAKVAIDGRTASVEVVLDGRSQGRVSVSDGWAQLHVDLHDVGAGEHVLRVVSDDAVAPLLEHSFVRSHPLYVVVSNDWDTSDHGDDRLRRQEQLHRDHAELLLTHFVGPYTFTDDTVPEERKRLLTAWVTNLRDTEGDEIGLHIHPYCNFVEDAGVTCRTEPQYASSSRPDGYTVYSSAYEEDEYLAMLRHADELFAAHGLGKPTSFRAGGWTLGLHTLRALGRAGYVADTSANNFSRMEEWKNVPGTSLYEWNAEHWAGIGETSQPWWPSANDFFGSEAPLAGVLEVPDNGILVDYVTADEMVEMFEANWSGDALGEPRQYSIGYHPVSFTEPFYQRLDEALFHIDGYLASQDDGPVVYARLSDLVKVWPMPG